jgi:hypothetical protein
MSGQPSPVQLMARSHKVELDIVVAAKRVAQALVGVYQPPLGILTFQNNGVYPDFPATIGILPAPDGSRGLPNSRVH